MKMKSLKNIFQFVLAMFLTQALPTLASEANLVVPDIKSSPFNFNLLLIGTIGNI